MKRAILLATVALMAMLVLVPMAMAQDTTMMMGTTMMEQTGGQMMGDTMMQGTMMEMTSGQMADDDLPTSVVRHGVTTARGRASGRFKLPVGTIPCPSLTVGFTVPATEQNYDLADRIKGHGVIRAHRGTQRRLPN